uniref:RNA helicase n=1 Tax=Hubei virga-like virus 22 TaxID=1923337 RepID=A0A1L3KK00_9VIRU|nr:hypothetical protein [Hubei virga-like virus 22]
MGRKILNESVVILLLASCFVFLVVFLDSFVKSFYVVEVAVPDNYYQLFKIHAYEVYSAIKLSFKDFDYLELYNNLHHSITYSCTEVTSVFGYSYTECRERHLLDMVSYSVYNLLDKFENFFDNTFNVVEPEPALVPEEESYYYFIDVLSYISRLVGFCIFDVIVPFIRFCFLSAMLVFLSYLLQQYFDSIVCLPIISNNDDKPEGGDGSSAKIPEDVVPILEDLTPTFPIDYKVRIARFRNHQNWQNSDTVYDLSELFTLIQPHDTENAEETTEVIVKPVPKTVNRRVIEMQYDLFELLEKLNSHDSLIVAHCVSSDFKMSAGIAKTFVSKFKTIKDQLCVTGVVPDLQIVQSRLDSNQQQYMIAHLITKNFYYEKPTLQCVRESIVMLFDEISTMSLIDTLVIPKLGCGLDKLIWADVRKIIDDELKKITRNFTVVVCDYNPAKKVDKVEEKVFDEISTDYTPLFKLNKNYLWLPALTTTADVTLDDLREAFNQFSESYKKKFGQPVQLITSYNHEIAPGKNFYACLSCKDINECPYLVEFQYKIHKNSYLTDKLVDVDGILSRYNFRFIPYSCDYELAYNSILEKLLINVLTKEIIEKEMKTLNIQIRSNLETTYDKKINSIQELKENKNFIISVYDSNKCEFLTHNKFQCEKAVDSLGNIVDVEIRRDNYFVFKKPANLSVEDDGIYIFCNRIEIFNEPVIIPKQVTVLKNFVINYFTPAFNLINGVPGCGKTTRTIRDFKPNQKILIVTATRDAAKDVRNRLSKLHDVNCGVSLSVYNKLLTKFVRTIDSVLVNENRLLVDNLFVDEALMQHAGDVYSLIVLCNPRVINLVGDIAQIPFVNRIASYVTLYQNFPFKISERLYTSYRCPVDVMLAISKSYDSEIHSASKVVESLDFQLINVVSEIDFCSLNEKEGTKQVIVFKQAEKLAIISLLKQLNLNIKVNTVHEFQGQQAAHIYIIRLSDRPQEEVYLRNAYALVAISRHTVTCKYWSFCNSDAITKLMLNAKRSSGGAYTTAADIQRQQNIVLNQPVNQSHTCLVELETKYINYIHDLQRADGVNGLIDLTVELGRGYTSIDKDFVDTDKTVYTHISSAHNYIHETIYDVNSIRCFDPALLQMEFDRILPRNAVSDLAGTAMLLQHSDLSLNLDNVRVRGKFMAPVDIYKHDNRTLKPVLKTSCPINRVETTQEILLGIQKRNSNVPEMQGLVDAGHNANAIYKDFIRTFIDPRKYHVLADYKQSCLGASKRNVLQWFDLSSFKPSYMFNDFYIDILSAEFNKFSYSIKPQPKPVQTYNASVTYQPLQTISAHKRYLNSYFCPIIKEFKARLTSVLKKKYHIFTDESNADFVKNLNTFCNPGLVQKLLLSDQLFIKELDISKYDKSQGAEALLFCCALMKLFGISEDVVDYYFKCNLLNYLKCGTYGISFTVNYQMKSGTAPTLIFNTLFTMAVNGLVYDDSFVYYACFCGDDATFFLSTNIKRYLKDFDTSQFTSGLLNLETKELSFKYTYFCSRFMLASNNSWYVIADPVKLLNKLGRSDILDFAHAEEYRVSACDNFKVSNNEILFLLNFAISERYNIPTSNVNLIKNLQICLSSPELFQSLFYKPSNYVEPKGFFRASIKF